MAYTLNLRGLYRRLMPRQLTPGEKQELEAEQKARKHLREQRSLLESEARKFCKDITEKLVDLNVCYRFKQNEKDWLTGGIKVIAFRRPFVLSEEAIYLEVDLRPGRSPRGVGVDDLSDEKVLKNLAIACEHPVYVRYESGKGFWYIIERETGKRGIPVHVKYDDMLSARPASADGLSLPIGIGENKKPIYRSLGQMYSMLVAGTIGGGKSNFLSVLLCTLLRYNSPRRLKLVLVDLKGGMEFSFFQGVPHLMQLPAKALKPPKKAKKGKDIVVKEGKLELEDETVTEDPEDPEDSRLVPAIIEKREQVPGALKWLIDEGERRMDLMKGKAKHIGQYNHKFSKKALPHIVLVIDEWGDVKLEPTVGKTSEERLINIAGRFRAVGIHVILCTQTPNKDVVSIRVKNVMPARLVFNCPDQFASMLLLGDGAAHGLNPAGRSFFVWGGTRVEAQTPFINNAAVDEVVAQAVAGKFNDVETVGHDVTNEEILEWALASNNGDLDYRAVHNQFRLRGLSQQQAKDICASFEGQEVVIGSATYRVLPGGPRKARKLIPIAEPDEEVLEEEQPPANEEEASTEEDNPTGEDPPSEEENP